MARSLLLKYSKIAAFLRFDINLDLLFFAEEYHFYKNKNPVPAVLHTHLILSENVCFNLKNACFDLEVFNSVPVVSSLLWKVSNLIFKNLEFGMKIVYCCVVLQ